VGLQAPVTLTGDPLMAELRDQRSRDFYLDNHRLGDLRRYKKYYNVDLFPKGPYPGSTSGQIYNESIDCWPLSRSEIDQNPNIPKG
jgi:SusD/RagB-like outer membrane lipoprotein